MELYRREKINPAAGCLPMLIQIPVFFSLYKVLNIAIEIRHAPFVGWIKDLSAPDPLTLSVITHLPVPDHHGTDHVHPAKAQSDPDQQRSGADVCPAAAHLHVHDGAFCFRSGHLLDAFQHPFDHPAESDCQKERRKVADGKP